MSRETGSWLTTLPSTVDGTELSALEFRDRLHQRYCSFAVSRLIGVSRWPPQKYVSTYSNVEFDGEYFWPYNL